MLKLNLENVEERVFYNKPLRKLLPEFKSLFAQWDNLLMTSGTRKKVVADFLNQITAKQVAVLSGYFGSEVRIEKLDYHIVKHYDFAPDGAESRLCEIRGILGFTVSRDADHIYLSTWR